MDEDEPQTIPFKKLVLGAAGLEALDTSIPQYVHNKIEYWAVSSLPKGLPGRWFVEFLMNYGEAANEPGKTNEAYRVLKDIRNRACIIADVDGSYGITATSTVDILIGFSVEKGS
jgi:hypothetical protein